MKHKWINNITHFTGKPIIIICVLFSLLLYFILGLIFKFSDTYNLYANTYMSAISYFLLFAIQYTQNRDTKAINIKLDEIIKSLKKARNEIIVAEKMDDDELDKIENEFQNLSNKSV